MKKNKIITTILFLLFFSLILQTGIIGFSMVTNQNTELISLSGSIEETESIIISEEVKKVLEEADPENYDKNLNNYKNLLIDLDVHTTYKIEIERLILEGHNISDILSIYEFLYHKYGNINELESLVIEKELGRNLSDIFKVYNEKNIEFKPRSFDSDYLEKLIMIPEITTDDIMIADRVSQKTNINYEEIMDKKINGLYWKDINVEFGIINSQENLPRVKVSKEEIEKYISLYGLTEQQVIEAFVIANKINHNPQEVIEKTKENKSEEDIFAEYFIEKYY